MFGVWIPGVGRAHATREVTPAISSLRSRFREVSVEFGNDGRPLPDGAADGLNRSGPHVSDGKDAGDTRLMMKRRSGAIVSAGRVAREAREIQPVRTNPLVSKAAPQFRSQSVAGSAPMNKNRLRIRRSDSTPVRCCFQPTRSSLPSGESQSAVDSVR